MPAFGSHCSTWLVVMKIAFLTSSRVLLLLLVQEPHSESRWGRGSGSSPFFPAAWVPFLPLSSVPGSSPRGSGPRDSAQLAGPPVIRERCHLRTQPGPGLQQELAVKFQPEGDPSQREAWGWQMLTPPWAQKPMSGSMSRNSRWFRK